jgi:pyruvate kinase
VVEHPLVRGLRLNTVMPLKESHVDVVRRLASLGSRLWVDLKGRQLRVVEAAIPPFTEVRVSHPVAVDTPCDAFFSDGREYARIVAVDGPRLILQESPRRMVGPGESVNIVDSSLRIEGTLTSTDRAYLQAMREAHVLDVMISFVEEPGDVDEVLDLLPGARPLLKIESQRGLAFVSKYKASKGRLMAARGDLYVEVLYPHRIIGAMRDIIAADAEAVAASRLFPSLARHPVPDAADISDAAYLMALGYRTFMLGDEVCMRRDSVLAALNLLEAVAREAI